MKQKENRISLMLGVPGILMQIVGNVMNMSAKQQQVAPSPLALLLLVGGTLLLITGLCFYAIAKGRSPLWGIVGLLSCLGLLILALLSDKSEENTN